MQRRDFLKISAATSAAAALEGCGNPDHQLIRFIPDEDLTPGVATWKPSICTMCGAGCGLLVRVMEAEAEVVRDGQLGLLKMGVAKKIEGNPAHPVNQGKLCPRGQAGLQITYHPERIMGPMARTGDRGTGKFESISWDEAQKRLVAALGPLATAKQKGPLLFLTRPLQGTRRTMVSNFTAAFGGSTPAEFEFFDRAAQIEANLRSFGQASLPVVDFAQSGYIISFGADFLGTWNSPVSQSLGYGAMRQAKPGQRGKFVTIEPRMSQTGASADEFVGCVPGSEGAVALSIAHVLMAEKLRPGASGSATSVIDGWSAGLPDYAPENVSATSGIPAAAITKIAREAAAHGPAVALIGDGATAQTNGLFNAMAVNALNALLGSVGKPGGLQFPASGAKAANTVTTAQIVSAAGAAKAVLLNAANPVFASPADSGVRDALMKAPFIASFGSFIDETSILADVILPDHSPLESWLDDVPERGTLRSVHSIAPPTMAPLHQTKAMPDVLLATAQQLGGDAAKSLPWKGIDEAIKASVGDLQKEKGGSVTGTDANDLWTKATAAGGWWSADDRAANVGSGKGGAVKTVAAQFDGEAGRFPFHFLPFASQMFYDGSLAHLPWLQEAPDPLSTVMWDTWLEINPTTAKKLSIVQGDVLQVTSQHGSLAAHALIAPGVAPDVIAMPIGQGHQHFTRTGARGTNTLAILAPLTVADTNAWAWAGTRVAISKQGPGRITVFAGALNEKPPEIMHR
jgi:menaquinone reductase, molybdopterin-binding-like subunit